MGRNPLEPRSGEEVPEMSNDVARVRLLTRSPR
jgi:hypothetical protein